MFLCILVHFRLKDSCHGSGSYLPACHLKGHPEPDHLSFVVKNVALESILLRKFRFYSVRCHTENDPYLS
jgi:hypothetical protein